MRPQVLRTGVEAVLAVALAFQLARLIWAVATPVGAFGDLGAPVTTAAPSAGPDLSILERFNPFFRETAPAASAPVVATSLPLTLHGVRIDQGSGRGSAIVGTPEGQASYVVGEEVVPGVRLAGVAFDHILLERGGAREHLFMTEGTSPSPPPPMPAAANRLDQEIVPGDEEAEEGAAAGGESAGVDPEALLAQTAFRPRLEGGRVTGFTVSPRASGDAFRNAGLRAGDVVVAVNGAPLDPDRMGQLGATLEDLERAELEIERDGQRITQTLEVAR